MGDHPEALAALLSRHSQGIRYLADPGPNADQLKWMALAALRAPDHARLRPFRFSVVEGPSRIRLAELFAQAARDAGKDVNGIALDAERAAGAPVTVAVIARIDHGHPLVPAHEQWMAVGGAVANFLNAAHFLGFGGKLLSGAKVRHAKTAQAFCTPGEILVGWVSLGTPVRQPSARGESPEFAQVLGNW